MARLGVSISVVLCNFLYVAKRAANSGKDSPANEARKSSSTGTATYTLSTQPPHTSHFHRITQAKHPAACNLPKPSQSPTDIQRHYIYTQPPQYRSNGKEFFSPPIHTHPDPYRSRYPSPDILAGNRHWWSLRRMQQPNEQPNSSFHSQSVRRYTTNQTFYLRLRITQAKVVKI